MPDRFWVIVPADTVRAEDFKAALDRAKKFAVTNNQTFAVLEAICIADPNGQVTILEKPLPKLRNDSDGA